MNAILFGGALAALVVSADAPREFSAEIQCSGAYGGHLQGIATDHQSAIFWSFTVDLVKTDLDGKVLCHVNVPTHHGDLTCVDGKAYVAVNLGAFNKEAGSADSWVYVYSASDLAFLSKHPVQEAVHGAGGMAYREGRFYVVGGLPEGYDENYVYEYDTDFRFVQRHVLRSGYTRLGIQTVEWFDGRWWFGCYGEPRTLLEANETFEFIARHDGVDFSYGIAAFGADTCLRADTIRQKEPPQLWTGTAVIDKPGARQAAQAEEAAK